MNEAIDHVIRELLHDQEAEAVQYGTGIFKGLVEVEEDGQPVLYGWTARGVQKYAVVLTAVPNGWYSVPGEEIK